MNPLLTIKENMELTSSSSHGGSWFLLSQLGALYHLWCRQLLLLLGCRLPWPLALPDGHGTTPEDSGSRHLRMDT